MRWLITGAGGMLGAELTATLAAERSEEVTPLSRSGLDVCDPGAVRAAVRRYRPDVVVNCAAWTAVDAAETHEAEALAVNGRAVGGLAEACADHGARLVQISTDYVFDGASPEPYPEDAPVCPVNVYGRSKALGERAALGFGHHVVRTAWLYGAGGGNFASTMIRLARTGNVVPVVDDQAGQPTWTGDLAAQILRLVRADAPPGVYHGTNAGRTTWYGFAREIFAALGADPDRVKPVGSEEFPRPARRPASGVLGHAGWDRAGLAPMRDWREALRAAWPALPGSSQ
ncbi:NAD(P)-dependent oxidoreductase [Microtetraspora sp. NBRC 13810]|uniref:dTDP-4-dehydrorhamnose reductase n=1 Tax=Microtetraspora sp. NBRC 13810 TaxID=3030990 RepID=UPI00255333F9|nr:dTDP-4-dehydrorhamnose reductase [Microtetraspora sp. NBRC 13810]GLW08808.1 NAD(P)-dependent oxidoreductase [Microtetraspora sp. NBRC 13810]